MTGVSANAQLKVNISGKVGIKTTEDPLSALSINCAGNSSTQLYVKGAENSIYSQRKGYTDSWGYALNSKSCTEETNFSVGVLGESISSDWKSHESGRSFGVMGCAGYATSGWNYGIFGRLQGTSNGAAIYGTSNAHENGTYVEGRYAGYFNGNVQINGALNVSGAINGVILGQAATTSNQIAQYSSRNANNEMEMSVADKLSSLTAVSYYKEQPMARMAAAQNIGDSTEVTKQQLSFVQMQDMEKTHYGLSAEQVESVFPELVYDNEDGSKSINYMEMVPLLIQSINELKSEIEVLKGNRVQGKKSATTGLSAIEETEVLSLGQNTPNPFHTTTSIPVTIPQYVKMASLIIYNMNGKQIKQIELSSNGTENITINSSELEAGMYIYTLLADGKIVATKRMVLTK